MRRSTLTADQIFEAEKAVDDRKQTRKSGFAMAEVRDEGWHRLKNGVVIEWPVAVNLAEGQARTYIPEGTFVLHTDKEDLIFDADEFRRWLRWVG